MSNRWFEIQYLEKDGPALIFHNLFEDQRGHFFRTYCENALSELGFRGVRQINSSHSVKAGTFRGLHYQTHPFCEAKIVLCKEGKINDYMIDMREKSPFLGRVYRAHVTKSQSIFVPRGFAHGFQTLEDHTSLIYLHDEKYSVGHETGVSVFSDEFNIELELPITEMSSRDNSFAFYGNENVELL